jgi:hypothetical protein
MAQAPRRRQRQKAHFREAGAEHVIVYTDEDFVAHNDFSAPPVPTKNSVLTELVEFRQPSL